MGHARYARLPGSRVPKRSMGKAKATLSWGRALFQKLGMTIGYHWGPQSRGPPLGGGMSRVVGRLRRGQSGMET